MYLTSHQWDLLRAIAQAPRVGGTMVWVQASNELQLFLPGRPLLATGLAATWFDIAVLSSEGLVQRIAGGGSNTGLRVGPKGIEALGGPLAAVQQPASTALVQAAGEQPAATALAKAAGAQPVVFIGHGRAKDWLELDRYLREDLNLAV